MWLIVAIVEVHDEVNTEAKQAKKSHSFHDCPYDQGYFVLFDGSKK